MEEQLNKEAKEGWRCAAVEARINDERTSSKDNKHTLGGVFVAVDSNLGAVVGEKEQWHQFQATRAESPRLFVNVRGGMRVLSVYFWHSEGWTPRNEALLEGSVEASQSHHTSMAGGM